MTRPNVTLLATPSSAHLRASGPLLGFTATASSQAWVAQAAVEPPCFGVPGGSQETPLCTAERPHLCPGRLVPPRPHDLLGSSEPLERRPYQSHFTDKVARGRKKLSTTQDYLKNIFRGMNNPTVSLPLTFPVSSGFTPFLVISQGMFSSCGWTLPQSPSLSTLQPPSASELAIRKADPDL